MARRKNPPESVRAKTALANRLRQIRTEKYGERGGPELSRRLGLPIRTWYNYETGVTVPAEVLLRFVELTGVEPLWLLHGKGSRYRSLPPSLESNNNTTQPVSALLRKALEHLGQAAEGGRGGPAGAAAAAAHREGKCVLPQEDVYSFAPKGEADELARRSDSRCVLIEGDAMAPLALGGSFGAYSAEDEPAADLDGRLVVAWVDRDPIVRWLQTSGPYALLRAENPDFSPNILTIDLTNPRNPPRFRRLLWIVTTH
jgi:hypothetical protein